MTVRAAHVGHLHPRPASMRQEKDSATHFVPQAGMASCISLCQNHKFISLPLYATGGIQTHDPTLIDGAVLQPSSQVERCLSRPNQTLRLCAKTKIMKSLFTYHKRGYLTLNGGVTLNAVQFFPLMSYTIKMVGFIRSCIFSHVVPFIVTTSTTEMCTYELKLWSQKSKT